MRWSAVALSGFLLIFAAETARAASRNLSPRNLSIVEKQDIFYPDFNLSLGLTDRQNGFRTLRTLTTAFGYGFSSGIELSALVPVIIDDSHPSIPGAKTPRLGGGSDSRAEITGAFRLTGDMLDYLALSVSAGLPYQTDGATRNSPAPPPLNSWNMPLELFGRLDFTRWAVLPSFTDIFSFPEVTEDRQQTIVYSDPTNTLILALKVFFYPSPRFSPWVSTTETLPTRTDIGTDSSSQGLLGAPLYGNRDLSFTFGLDGSPYRFPLLVTVEATYHATPASPNESRWAYAGGLRWLF